MIETEAPPAVGKKRKAMRKEEAGGGRESTQQPDSATQQHAPLAHAMATAPPASGDDASSTPKKHSSKKKKKREHKKERKEQRAGVNDVGTSPEKRGGAAGDAGSLRGSTSPSAPAATDATRADTTVVPATQTEKQPAQHNDVGVPGDAQAPSPAPERRRMGKTHGRARKTPGTGEGSQRRGATGSESVTLTPGGPGQGKPRKHTLSIAIPGSVVDNAQNRELKTYLVGEIARAAAIFEVDEIVIYDDLSVSRKGQGGVRDDSASGSFNGRVSLAGRGGEGGAGSGGGGGVGDRNNPNVFMARLLQYAETPQYLRRQLFPMHSSLKLAGLLNPLDAPHHMRADDDCPFREGVVLDRTIKKGAGSFVDIGKRKEARIDRPLAAGVRVTVKLDKGDPCKRNHKGRAVPPSAPREELGLYWGYQTRLASGMADVLAGCPYKGGYDLTMGTSERGSVTVDSPEFALPTYRHVLVVFGGVQGIEATLDADETLQLPGSEASALFDMWVNTCPGQGSRTIRTEEAVLITLARLRQHVLGNGSSSAVSVASST